MTRPRAVVLGFAGFGIAAAAARADDALRSAVLADYRSALAPLFEHFHRNPELSFREFKTAERLASELRALGYQVTEKVGGAGVVAVLRNGDGPTVMLRADMDGLPIQERSGLAYASTARQTDAAGVEQPVMHACGHDVHITALVGSARQLMLRRGEWSGTLVLIGQPAEEKVGGARAMLADGLYTRFPKPDYALAFHVSAELPSGRVEVPLDAAYAGADTVEVVMRGFGGHGASPHKTIDPVVMAAQTVMSLQTLVSRTISPHRPGVVTVGAIHGGVRHNIIPDEVRMLLTVRSEDPETRKTLLEGIERVAAGTAKALGAPPDRMPIVTVEPDGTTPPTVNHHATALRVRDAMTRAMGEARMIDKPREGMGAEDFAYFVQPDLGVKGVYFQVGGTPEKDVPSAPSHHSAEFKIEPEPAVTSGVEATVVAAMAMMPKAAPPPALPTK